MILLALRSSRMKGRESYDSKEVRSSREMFAEGEV